MLFISFALPVPVCANVGKQTPRKKKDWANRQERRRTAASSSWQAHAERDRAVIAFPTWSLLRCQLSREFYLENASRQAFKVQGRHFFHVCSKTAKKPPPHHLSWEWIQSSVSSTCTSKRLLQANSGPWILLSDDCFVR